MDDGTTERESFVCEESSVQEPFVGMEFESEDAAKEFYDEYARSVGFIMRIDQCRRSEVDERILSRRLSCNKQGCYYVKMKDQNGLIRKQRTGTTREGCKAMMLVKVNKTGKWVVTRFVKDHSHPLMVSARTAMVRFFSSRIIFYHISLAFFIFSFGVCIFCLFVLNIFVSGD